MATCIAVYNGNATIAIKCCPFQTVFYKGRIHGCLSKTFEPLCVCVFQLCVVAKSQIQLEWCSLLTGLKPTIKARTASGESMSRRTRGSCWTFKCTYPPSTYAVWSSSFDMQRTTSLQSLSLASLNLIKTKPTSPHGRMHTPVPGFKQSRGRSLKITKSCLTMTGKTH